MLEFISETFNRIINKRNTYRCIAFIDDRKSADKLVETFEIKEFSIRRTYLTAYEMLSLKYPNMGYDVRILNEK